MAPADSDYELINLSILRCYLISVGTLKADNLLEYSSSVEVNPASTSTNLKQITTRLLFASSCKIFSDMTDRGKSSLRLVNLHGGRLG